jgi:uncharacterized protein DUF4136
MQFRMILPLSLLVVGSALAQDVRYNYDHKVDFNKFRTYKWVEIKGAGQLDQLMDRQLKDVIDVELAKKGLAKTDGENADLFIGYQAAINQEKEFSSFSSGFGPGWGYGAGWGYGWGGYGSSTTTVQTSTIHIGSIGFDMYDAAKRELVWRGTASKTLDPKAKPDKREKNLKKAVAKLLKNYPPPVKKS